MNTKYIDLRETSLYLDDNNGQYGSGHLFAKMIYTTQGLVWLFKKKNNFINCQKINQISITIFNQTMGGPDMKKKKKKHNTSSTFAGNQSNLTAT